MLVLYPSTSLFPISHPPIEDISEWIMSPLNHINFDGPEDNIRSRKYASKGKAGCGNDEVASIYQKGKGERPGKSPTINQKSGSYFAFCYCRYFFCSSSQLTRVSINSIHEFCDPWTGTKDEGRTTFLYLRIVAAVLFVLNLTHSIETPTRIVPMDAKVEEESHLKGYIVEQHDSVDVGVSSNLISSHTACPISFHFAPPFLCLSLSPSHRLTQNKLRLNILCCKSALKLLENIKILPQVTTYVYCAEGG